MGLWTLLPDYPHLSRCPPLSMCLCWSRAPNQIPPHLLGIDGAPAYTVYYESWRSGDVTSSSWLTGRDMVSKNGHGFLSAKSLNDCWVIFIGTVQTSQVGCQDTPIEGGNCHAPVFCCCVFSLGDAGDLFSGSCWLLLHRRLITVIERLFKQLTLESVLDHFIPVVGNWAFSKWVTLLFFNSLLSR